jgi:hypothetical protein
MTLSALENSAFVPEYRPGSPPASKEQQLGSVADPDPWMGKNPDHNSESLTTNFWVKTTQVLVADSDPGSKTYLTLASEWKYSDPECN